MSAKEFVPVSVKMAKAQGLALNPTKISGQCGRLLCCLAYEYETYSEMNKTLPKCGKKLQLEAGTFEVISRDILAQKVTLFRNGDRSQIHIDELNKELDGAKDSQTTAPEKQQEPTRKKPSERPGRTRNNQVSTKQHTDTQSKQVPEQKQQVKKDESGQEKSKRRRRRPRRRSNRQNKPTENKT